MSKVKAGAIETMVSNAVEYERALALVTSGTWEQAIMRADLVKAAGSAGKAAALVTSAGEAHGIKVADSTMRAWARIGRLIKDGQIKASADQRQDARGVQDLVTLVTSTGGGPALTAALKATSASRTAAGLAESVRDIMRENDDAAPASTRPGPDPMASVAGRVATLANNDPEAVDAILAQIRAAALARISERATEAA